MKSGLNDFWQWLRKRRVITLAEMPEFPEIPFELGFRNTVSKDIQEQILAEIHWFSYHINPKIWLGIRWLCTYVSIRPGELISTREGNIDLGNGYLFIPHLKGKKPKMVPLLEEDVEVIRALPRGVPSMPFFRHVSGISGTRENAPFGAKYLYKRWGKACLNLGIEGVDLYGGTRHSSAKALRQFCSPEEIKRATMHSTNKAFERYFQIEADDLRTIHGKTQGAKETLRNYSASKNGNVLKLK
jgi:integrase